MLESFFYGKEKIMVEIKSDDIELLKDVCEALAYKVAQYENPRYYAYSDTLIAEYLRNEGLKVECY